MKVAESKKPKQAELPALAQLPVFEYRGQLVVDSRDVAAIIERPHYDLLKSIRRYCKYLTEGGISVSDYFFEVCYTDSTGRELPCFNCTEMGCDLIAHKQDGERGTIFTARYVKAFHTMRDALLERQSLQWQQARIEGKTARRLETDAIKAFVTYAADSGSKNAQKYYVNFTKLAYSAIGAKPGDRDSLSIAQLLDLRMAEQIIDRAIWAELAAGTEYHETYRRAKTRVQMFIELALAPRALQRPCA